MKYKIAFQYTQAF